MNKTDLQKEIEATKKQLERLQKQLEADKNWFPVEGEKFYYVHPSLVVFSHYHEAEYDEYNTSNYGKVFRTHEQAQRCADALKAIRGLSFKPDWGDGQEKWSVYAVDGRLRLESHTRCNTLGCAYFPSKAVAHQAIPHYEILMEEGYYD